MSSEKETGVPVAFTGEEVSALVDAINALHAWQQDGDGTPRPERTELAQRPRGGSE